MQITISISKREIKNLKLIRNYFGEHDKTQMEHMAYSELDKLIKKLSNEQTHSKKNTAGIQGGCK